MRDARCGIWIRSTHGFSPMVIKIGLYALKSWSFAISPCFKLAGTSFVLAMFTETVSVSQLAFLKKSVAVFNVSRVIAFTTILPLTVNFYEQSQGLISQTFSCFSQYVLHETFLFQWQKSFPFLLTALPQWILSRSQRRYPTQCCCF